jgi:hypothetical protein
MRWWTPGLTLAQLEKNAILEAYEFYGKDKTRTAMSLGITVRTLYNKFGEWEGKETQPEEVPPSVPAQSTASGIHMESSKEISKEPAMPLRKREKVQKMLP